MVVSCCVTGCTNRYKPGSDITFFRIPTLASRRKEWILAINRLHSKSSSKMWDPSTYSRICSQHFETGKPSKDPNHKDYVPNKLLCLDELAKINEERKRRRQKILIQRKKSDKDNLPEQLQQGAAKGYAQVAKSKNLLKDAQTKGKRNKKSPLQDHNYGDEDAMDADRNETVNTNQRQNKSGKKRYSTHQTTQEDRITEEESQTATDNDTAYTPPSCNEIGTQTCLHPGESYSVLKGKQVHLEKEIALLQKMNTELRAKVYFQSHELNRLSMEAWRKRQDNIFSSVYLKDFEPQKVLSEDHHAKRVYLEGLLPAKKYDEPPERAVVMLERKPIDMTTIKEIFSRSKAKTIETFYSTRDSVHDVFSGISIPDIQGTVICPVTDKDIARCSRAKRHIVEETPHMYNTVTKPCMAKHKADKQWMYRILNHKAQLDRIIAEDSDTELGLVLMRHIKWNGKNKEQLHIVGICHKRGIKSLRHLTHEHLPLLRYMREFGKLSIKEAYGIPADQLRIFINYRPSYEHLHIHFSSICCNFPSAFDPIRSHLVNDVIQHIESQPDYYQTVTLSYVVNEDQQLYKSFQSYGYFVDEAEASIQEDIAMEDEPDIQQEPNIQEEPVVQVTNNASEQKTREQLMSSKTVTIDLDDFRSRSSSMEVNRSEKEVEHNPARATPSQSRLVSLLNPMPWKTVTVELPCHQSTRKVSVRLPEGESSSAVEVDLPETIDFETCMAESLVNTAPREEINIEWSKMVEAD